MTQLRTQQRLDTRALDKAKKNEQEWVGEKTRVEKEVLEKEEKKEELLQRGQEVMEKQTEKKKELEKMNEQFNEKDKEKEKRKRALVEGQKEAAVLSTRLERVEASLAHCNAEIRECTTQIEKIAKEPLGFDFGCFVTCSFMNTLLSSILFYSFFLSLSSIISSLFLFFSSLPSSPTSSILSFSVLILPLLSFPVSLLIPLKVQLPSTTSTKLRRRMR